MFSQLEKDFVLGWKNIRKEDFVGYSSGYKKTQCSVGTTNGAGPRNLQMFVLSPDMVVLHALPGFWHPEDLAEELTFAKKIARLWEDGKKSRETKEKMFERMHRRHVYTSSTDTYARSTWQHFDAHTERHRAQRERRDTVLRNSDGTMAQSQGQLRLKPINVLVHERMVKQPFRAFDEFDVEAFVDYGKLHYDNNGFEKSRVQFAGQKTLKKKRRRAAKKRGKRS